MTSWVRAGLLGLCLGLPATVCLALPLRIQLTLANEAQPRAAGKLKLVITPVANADKALPEPRTVAAEAPGQATVDLPAGWAWRIRTESTDWWSEELWLPPILAEPVPPATLRLFRAASLVASLQLPEGGKRPTTVELRFQPAPGEASRFPRSIVSCPLGRVRCLLPAAALDLRLKAEGYIPKYFWGLEIKPGRAFDLGKITLDRGASVAGWVLNEVSQRVSSQTTVELAPWIPGPQTIPNPRELTTALSRKAVVNERGFFQIAGVQPGTYSVTASHAGVTSATVFPVQVFADLEAEIRDALRLAPPVAIKVLVDPPTDPSGEPWGIHLQKRAALESFQGLASREGIWEQRGLAAGSYELRVTGTLGSRWFSDEVEVRAGDSAVHVEMPVVKIRGQVTRGNRPLTATLWFGGRSAPRRIFVRTDDTGELDGVLPEEGTWPVDLWSEKEGLRLALDPVEVKRAAGKSYARVDIRVPDTRLAGEVVDEDGHPLADASVMVASKARQNSQSHTDEKGEFEILGLPPGRNRLEAHAGERTSGWVEVALEEGHEAPRLRLVARSKVEIQGRVLSPWRPVGGARLLALPEVESGALATVEETISRMDGSFSLRLPAGTHTVSLLVHAPGFALRMLRAAVDPETFLDVPVEATGGTLVFRLGDSTAPEGERARTAVLLHGDTWTRLETLARWVTDKPLQRRDGALEIPDMEPGDYSLCTGQPGQKLAELVRTSCAQGYLAPLQELILEVPSAR